MYHEIKNKANVSNIWKGFFSLENFYFLVLLFSILFFPNFKRNLVNTKINLSRCMVCLTCSALLWLAPIFLSHVMHNGARPRYSTRDHWIKLNKCETGPYFLQDFQCTTMFISCFVKVVNPCCMNLKLFKNFAADFQANNTDII